MSLALLGNSTLCTEEEAQGRPWVKKRISLIFHKKINIFYKSIYFVWKYTFSGISGTRA